MKLGQQLCSLWLSLAAPIHAIAFRGAQQAGERSLLQLSTEGTPGEVFQWLKDLRKKEVKLAHLLSAGSYADLQAYVEKVRQEIEVVQPRILAQKAELQERLDGSLGPIKSCDKSFSGLSNKSIVADRAVAVKSQAHLVCRSEQSQLAKRYQSCKAKAEQLVDAACAAVVKSDHENATNTTSFPDCQVNVHEEFGDYARRMMLFFTAKTQDLNTSRTSCEAAKKQADNMSLVQGSRAPTDQALIHEADAIVLVDVEAKAHAQGSRAPADDKVVQEADAIILGDAHEAVKKQVNALSLVQGVKAQADEAVIREAEQDVAEQQDEAVSFLQVRRSMGEPCEKLKKRLAEKRADCDTLQDQMDSTSCGFKKDLVGACHGYGACYEAAERNRSTISNQIKSEELGLKTAWVAVLRLQCLMDASEIVASKRAATMQACIKKDYSEDAQEMALRHPQPAAAETCTVPSNVAGESEYNLRNYGPLPKDAPAKECSCCKGNFTIPGWLTKPTTSVRPTHRPTRVTSGRTTTKWWDTTKATATSTTEKRTSTSRRESSKTTKRIWRTVKTTSSTTFGSGFDVVTESTSKISADFEDEIRYVYPVDELLP